MRWGPRGTNRSASYFPSCLTSPPASPRAAPDLGDPQLTVLDSTPGLLYDFPMSSMLDSVAQDAMILPPDQRLELARQLLESVDTEPQFGAAAAWEEEIARRIEAFSPGESKAVPAGEVFARLRHIAPDR